MSRDKYGYYSTTIKTILVPVKVRMYDNIGIIHSFEPITEKNIEEAMKDKTIKEGRNVKIKHSLYKDRYGVVIGKNGTMENSWLVQIDANSFNNSYNCYFFTHELEVI